MAGGDNWYKRRKPTDIEYHLASAAQQRIKELEEAGNELASLVKWAVQENVTDHWEDGIVAVKAWKDALGGDE